MCIIIIEGTPASPDTGDYAEGLFTNDTITTVFVIAVAIHYSKQCPPDMTSQNKSLYSPCSLMLK